jgi:hypothetical protein
VQGERFIIYLKTFTPQNDKEHLSPKMRNGSVAGYEKIQKAQIADANCSAHQRVNISAPASFEGFGRTV